MSIKRINSFVIATLGVVLLSVAFAGTAQAEQCQQATPPGMAQSQDSITVCLVTDTSQPIVLPAKVQFLVPTKATRFTGTLIGPGPGDTNLWESEIGPEWATADQTLMFRTRASVPWPGPCDPANGAGCGSDDYDAAFAIPVLTPVGNLETKVVRKGKRFLGIVRYEGRVDITNHVKFLLGIEPSVSGDILTRKGKLVTRPVGPQVIRMNLSRRTVKQRCRDYRYCKLLVEVNQYHTYVDEQGRQRSMPLVPDLVNRSAGRVVKNTKRICRKLRQQRRKHTRAYRSRCPVPPESKTRTAAEAEQDKEKKKRSRG